MNSAFATSRQARPPRPEPEPSATRAHLTHEQPAPGSGFELLLAGYARPEVPLQFVHDEQPGTVSVVIPVYNGRTFLDATIRSVWSQTIDPARVEILVVDDGSTDGSGDVARRLCEESPMRMRVLEHPDRANRGVAATRNVAFRHAAGEFVALLDADDRYLPQRLETALAYFARHPQCDVLCSHGWYADPQGARTVGYNGTTVAGTHRHDPGELACLLTFEQLWRTFPVVNSSLTVRRSALAGAGGYPEVLSHQCEDWLLALKLSLRSPLHCLEEKLVLYTVHPDAYTAGYCIEGIEYGCRVETFFNILYWMNQRPEYREQAIAMFRRDFRRLMIRARPPGLRDVPAIMGRAFCHAFRVGFRGVLRDSGRLLEGKLRSARASARHNSK